jgi:hypothetical protein
VLEQLRPMGVNQVYNAFRTGQIPGGRRIGGRWYDVKKEFDQEYKSGAEAD